MVSRSNVGAAQHIQIDRGTVIRTFRQMNARDIESTGCAAFRSRRGQDPVPQDDTNGKRYTQVGSQGYRSLESPTHRFLLLEI